MLPQQPIETCLNMECTIVENYSINISLKMKNSIFHNETAEKAYFPFSHFKAMESLCMKAAGH